MNIPREIQAEFDRIKELAASAQATGETTDIKAEVERVMARASAKIKQLSELEVRRIAALYRGENDLVPLRLLAQAASIEAHKKQLQESKKDIAAYTSGRTFIRAAKRAILAELLILREEGLGVPFEPAYVSAWCNEDETLLSFEQMMPHSDVMVRVGEARAWLDSIGATIPPLLQITPMGRGNAADTAPDATGSGSTPAADRESGGANSGKQRAPVKEKRRTGYTKAVFAACEAVSPKAGETMKDAVYAYFAAALDKTKTVTGVDTRYRVRWMSKNGERDADEEALDNAIRAWRNERRGSR